MSDTEPPVAATQPGRVLEATGGVYFTELEDGRVVKAALRGRLKLERRTGERVVAGDRVRVLIPEADDDGASIEAVEPRTSELARRSPGHGRGARAIVANVERVVVVFAHAQPAPNPRLIDRFLVLAESNELPAVLVANKLDLDAETDAFAVYERIGYPVLRVSAQTGAGVAALREVLCDGVSVLAGPSGVGKSSLLNTIEPGLELRVGEVSSAVHKGKHTTVSARLIRLSCGGYVADTPGLRELGLWNVEADTLDLEFPEFREHLDACRFGRSCTHDHEPDCGVRSALEAGSVDPGRYESYRVLRQELEDAARRW